MLDGCSVEDAWEVVHEWVYDERTNLQHAQVELDWRYSCQNVTHVFNNKDRRPANLCSQVLYCQLSSISETDAGEGSFICKELVVAFQRKLLTRRIELRLQSVNQVSHGVRTWYVYLRILGSKGALYVRDSECIHSLVWKVEGGGQVLRERGPFRRRNGDGHHRRL